MSTIDLNPLPKLTIKTGSVSGGLAGSGNYYNFSVTANSIFNFKTDPIFVTGVSKGDSDLTLYQIVNGEILFTAGSTGITGEADIINTVLIPGDYQLEVLPFIGNVDYTLTINQTVQVNKDYSGFGINNSYSLGTIDWGLQDQVLDTPDHKLVSDAGTIIDFLGHKGDLHDAYSFTIDKPTTVTVTLTPDANSNVDLALYDDKDGQIIGSFNDTGVADTVTADLKAGTYWLDTMFVSSGNPKDPDTGTFSADYDLSIGSEQYVLPVTLFRPFNGNAAGLAETFNFNNSQQPETIKITNAVYSGKVEQSAVVNNFAGEVNAGVLLTTGDAKSLLGHNYNAKQGLSTSDAETVNNWSNLNGNQGGMQPFTGAGNAAGYNADVFKEVSKLVTEQNAVLDDAHKLDPITSVYDAASLSFDVAVTGKGNYLSFDLMFASEEFALFADKYVDSAVIMVDGKNYALFDKKDPTTLLSVTQANVDSGYFYPNTQLADGTSIYPTEFNGVSRLISVLAPIDTTLATHHISIAIADTNDHVLDSGFFLTNLDSLDLHRPTQPKDPVSNAGRDGLYSNKAGTAADDVLAGSENRDLSVLGGGNDEINTGGGNDVVDGGTGNDVIAAGTGDDLLLGGLGNDSVDGGLGGDEINGGAGKDNIAGGEGNDVIQGGDVKDTASNNLDGGTGNDFVTGAGGVDTITGGTGSDSVDGGAGNDRITGGTDNTGDSLNGGAGNDVIIDAGGADTVAGGAGNDTITAGGGADSVSGGTGRDVIDAGSGNDTIAGGTDSIGDSLNGGAGNDTVTAGAGADTVTGGTGLDSIDGGAGNDKITGGTDNIGDNLDGGTGNDTVTAGSGEDTISGGDGSDTVSGGAGQDDFVLDSDVGTDTITDFSVTDDTLSIDSSIFDAIGTTITEDNLATDGATDANDFLIYDSSTGSLSYDADGNGSGEAVQVAIIGANLDLTSSDFIVI
ncbi:MAG: choice-of-anchor L domain-containing protein [Methylococcaceae bacterium]